MTPTDNPLVLEAGRGPVRLRLDLGGGEMIYLDVRVTADRCVEVGVAPPTRASLVEAEAPRAEAEPPNPFDDPGFSRHLVEHLHRAKRKAIAEAEEAGRRGDA